MVLGLQVEYKMMMSQLHCVTGVFFQSALFKIGQGLEFGLSENDSRCCRWESSLQSQKGSILCHYTADAQAMRKYLAVSSLSPSTPRMSPPAWSQSARVSRRQRGMSTNTTYSLLPLSPAFNNTLSSPTVLFYCFDVVIKSNSREVA